MTSIDEFIEGMRIMYNNNGMPRGYTVSGVRFGTVYIVPTEKYGNSHQHLYEIELRPEAWGACVVV